MSDDNDPRTFRDSMNELADAMHSAGIVNRQLLTDVAPRVEHALGQYASADTMRWHLQLAPTPQGVAAMFALLMPSPILSDGDLMLTAIVPIGTFDDQAKVNELVLGCVEQLRELKAQKLAVPT